MKKINIGCGSGSATDTLEPAIDMIDRGNLQYICFDTMSEQSMPWHQWSKMQDPNSGYDFQFENRMSVILPMAIKKGIRIVGNFGSVNPMAAFNHLVKICTKLGLKGVRIGVIEGDDILKKISSDAIIEDTDKRLSDIHGKIISANAYIGAEPIAELLRENADIVIGGRIADPSLYLGCMMYEFDWPENNWDILGAGIILGHVVECGSFSTGGHWSEPGYRMVSGVTRLGNPIIEVNEQASARLTKAPDTGGMIAPDNFKAHLMHEINDPEKYFTPDVVADLTSVTFEKDEIDYVKVKWVKEPRGRERPSHLKAIVGIHEGYMGEALIIFAGYRALEKARLTATIAQEYITDKLGSELYDLRFDYIGYNATLGTAHPEPLFEPNEIMLRIAGLTNTKQNADSIARLALNLIRMGPIGMGERRWRVIPVFGGYPVLIPREKIKLSIKIKEIN